LLKQGKWIWSHDSIYYNVDRKGDIVTIVRPLTMDEADLHEVGPMYRCIFPDGLEIDAFDDELIGGPLYV
jgi:hypothetical protein